MQVINPLNYLVGIESQPKKETLSTLSIKYVTVHSLHEILQAKGICMQSFHKPSGLLGPWTYIHAGISQVFSNNHLN